MPKAGRRRGPSDARARLGARLVRYFLDPLGDVQAQARCSARSRRRRLLPDRPRRGGRELLARCGHAAPVARDAPADRGRRAAGRGDNHARQIRIFSGDRDRNIATLRSPTPRSSTGSRTPSARPSCSTGSPPSAPRGRARPRPGPAAPGAPSGEPENDLPVQPTGRSLTRGRSHDRCVPGRPVLAS